MAEFMATIAHFILDHADDWEAGIRTRLTTIRDTDPSYLTDAAE